MQGGAGGRVLLGPAGNLNVPPRLIVESRVAMVANPGPASYAAVVFDAGSGEEAMVASAAFGESTSIAAEYRGVIAGLAAAAQLMPGEPVEVRLTSEVVILQMTGGRAVKSPVLRPLRDAAVRVTAMFPAVVFTKASTDETARAYQLAVEALGTDLHDARASGARDRQATPAARAAPVRDRTAKPGSGRADPGRLGALRAAELLSELTGLSVQASDVEELAAAGMTSVVGHYKKRPLYDVAALRALTVDESHRAAIAELIAERTAARD
jgi:probable phosphoglycerate mutase